MNATKPLRAEQVRAVVECLQAYGVAPFIVGFSSGRMESQDLGLGNESYIDLGKGATIQRLIEVLEEN